MEQPLGGPGHWTELSDNPVDVAVHRFTLARIIRARAGVLRDYDSYLRNLVTERSVLDVGVVEHDSSHVEAPEWMHRKVVSWASRVVGVDILADQVASLKAAGYDVRHVDATSGADLQDRFDVAIVGDVIEHVDHPTDLLSFVARHLLPDGIAVVKTPNPFFWRSVWRTQKEGTFVANADHINWVTPSMALELAHRSGLELVRFWHLRENVGRRLDAWRERILDRGRGQSELLAYDFVCELAPRGDNL